MSKLKRMAGEFQQRSGITVRTEITDIELPDGTDAGRRVKTTLLPITLLP